MSDEILAYISLGSNEGDTARNMREAIALIGALPGVLVEAVSEVYLTEPQESLKHVYFANAAARCRCSGNLLPEEFMMQLLGIEAQLGRNRTHEERNGPRPIDLDLLLFGDIVMDSQMVILPHPRMYQRAFVLVPLFDIEPDMVLPNRQSLKEALALVSHSIHGRVIYQPAR